MLKDKIPNSLMYIALITLEDIMGKNGFYALLNVSGLSKYRDEFPPNNDEVEIPLSDFSSFFKGLLEIFGEKGARPLLYNLGRRSFNVILEENPALFGMVGLGLKVLPKKKRINKLNAIASKETNKIFGENQNYYSNDEGFVFEIYDCFWCKGLKTEGPICFAEVGWNAEAAKWATGNEYDVKEVLCRAKGDDVCKVVISPEPIKGD